MRIQQFDYSVDVLQAILWKYDKTVNLKGLLEYKQAWFNTNQQDFWKNWYDNVFNLLTANAFGLSVWSYILNVPLYLEFQPESPTKPNFGFNAYNPSYPTLLNSYLNFNNSNFSTKHTIITLTEEEQRFLLRLRYFQLCTRADVTDVNSFLNYLVSTSNIGFSGRIYMLDGLDMSITYVFTTASFPPDLLTVLKDLDVLPRPAGVKIRYEVVTGSVWGLGPYNQNFENGNFIETITLMEDF